MPWGVGGFVIMPGDKGENQDRERFSNSSGVSHSVSNGGGIWTQAVWLQGLFLINKNNNNNVLIQWAAEQI